MGARPISCVCSTDVLLYVVQLLTTIQRTFSEARCECRRWRLPSICAFRFMSAAAAVIERPRVQSEFNDTLFVMGGFGGWPEDDPRYNGMRCRNDVYKTKDGGERN